MKRNKVLIGAVALLCVACAKKEIDQQPELIVPDGAIVGTFENIETKAGFGPDMSFLWSEGDALKVLTNKRTREFVLASGAGKSYASFAGSIGDEETLGSVLAYPYDAVKTLTATQVEMVLPAEYTYTQSFTFGNGTDQSVVLPCYANIEGRNFTLMHLGGYIIYEISNIPESASKFVLKTTNGKRINGVFSADLTAESAMFSQANAASIEEQTVQIYFQANAAATQCFIIPVPQGEYAWTWDMYTGDDKLVGHGRQDATMVGRNNIVGFKEQCVTLGDDENPVDPSTIPFTITSVGNTSVAIAKIGSPHVVHLEYRRGNAAWQAYTFGVGIPLSDGESVQFRNGSTSHFSLDGANHYEIKATGSGTIKASGNIMSLLDSNAENIQMTTGEFYALFADCKQLVAADDLVLSQTILADSCYYRMFYGCTSLTTAPELPATTLADYCYYRMFYGCTSLTTAPKLPATTLADSCYESMFDGCTSLTTAPELPATTLADFCYADMFSNCTSLTTVPKLPATTLTGGCYESMFDGCISLTFAPELPATTLASWCYDSMFSGCTSLTTAPELPATTLADHCYEHMFHGCTSLTTAPELPATTLADHCYDRMFYGCTSLTTAPELPATTLARFCYIEMFSGCTNLNYVKALFSTFPSEHFTENWLYGVSSTGTFVKSRFATWDITGSNGVPNGWIIQLDDADDSDVVFRDNFDWLKPLIDKYNSTNTTPVGNAVDGHTPEQFADASGANAPNAYTAEPFKSEFPQALADAGYTDLNAAGKVLYPQDTYLKFGKTSVHTSLQLAPFPSSSVEDYEITFDWCRHVQGTAIIDPCTLTIVIEGDGVFENGTQFSDPIETAQKYQKEDSNAGVKGWAEMFWTNSKVTIKGATRNTKINIVYTGCLNKSTRTYNWTVTGAHRYHIDNIVIRKK